jgi:hypothetical protein
MEPGLLILRKTKLPLLKLLSVIFFLLMYAEGDKLGAFIFMMLIIYPFLIGQGSPDLLSLNLNRALTLPIDLVIFGMTYFSIYHLIKSRKINDRKSDKWCLFNIIIFYIYVFKIFMSPVHSVFSLVTIGLFMFISLLTIAVLIIKLYIKRA